MILVVLLSNRKLSLSRIERVRTYRAAGRVHPRLTKVQITLLTFASPSEPNIPRNYEYDGL